MNPDELLTLRQVAAALGLPLRTIRAWAEGDALDVVQPRRGAERMVYAEELHRLARAGYRVRWAAAADAADAATSETLSIEGLS